jgi:hypothetical protein
MRRKPGKIIWVILLLYSGLGMRGPAFSQVSPQIEYPGSGLRNPFESQLPKPKPVVVEVSAQPISQPEAGISQPDIQAPAIKLESQVSGGSQPRVIIDGKVLRVGDKVQEALITGITKEGMEVLYQERAFFFPAPSKKYKRSDIKGGKDE